MKQLLIILLTCFTLSASAQQQLVYDTTKPGYTLKVYPKSGSQKYDSIDVHPTVIGQVNKATSDVAGLQSTVGPLPGLINNLSSRVTTLEQGIPITVIDTPKRTNGNSFAE